MSWKQMITISVVLEHHHLLGLLRLGPVREPCTHFCLHELLSLAGGVPGSVLLWQLMLMESDLQEREVKHPESC